MNRGNGRQTVFHEPGDYDSFVTLLREAGERTPVRLMAYCLMPNHFHLVVGPWADGDPSRFMAWLMTAHVRRYHQHYHTSGHVWQGRFKSFPIQEDEHLLTVMRYVERNPVRTGLVKSSADWRWSSAAKHGEGGPTLDPGPVPRPLNWTDHVDRPQTEAELDALPTCLLRGRPYGETDWVTKAAERLGLESSLRPRGRLRAEGKL